MIFNNIALSVTSFVIGPIWSNDDAKATSPYLETSPYVGFKPTTPQSEAGCRIDPPVSEPSAHGTISDATAAALPPLDPPGTVLKFQGFFVVLNVEYSVEEPIANSSIFIFPILIIPAFFKFSTTVALYGAMKFSSIFELHVVFTPLVHKLSFNPIGIPATFDLVLLALFDSSKALSVVIVTKALTSFSFSSILFE